MSTRKWLHSHLFHSPLTNNQEVSAYGSDQESDGGDVWMVEWESKAKIWKQDGKVSSQGEGCETLSGADLPTLSTDGTYAFIHIRFG